MQIDIDKLIEGSFTQIEQTNAIKTIYKNDSTVSMSIAELTPFEQLISDKSSKIVKSKKPINRWKEGLRVSLVIVVSFLVGDIFTNFNLYMDRARELIYGQNQIAYSHEDKEQVLDKTNKTKNQQILSLFSNIEKEWTSEKDKLYAYFTDKPKNIQYKFNTLPPDRRIIIPSIWVESPIVNVDTNAELKMQEWEFTDDLKKWVVHYPTTPEPDINGNMMLFGHSSNYRWIKSAYNTIFSKLPQLTDGNEVIVIRDGKEYRYKVQTKQEVKPTDVPSVYASHHTNTKQLITLMTCYPVWTRDERMMVIAERVDENWRYVSNTTNNDLAYVQSSSSSN